MWSDDGHGTEESLGLLVKGLIGSILEAGCSKEEFLPLITTPQMPGFMLNTGAFPVGSQWQVPHSGSYAEATVSLPVFNTIPLTSLNTALEKTTVFTVLKNSPILPR